MYAMNKSDVSVWYRKNTVNMRYVIPSIIRSINPVGRANHCSSKTVKSMGWVLEGRLRVVARRSRASLTSMMGLKFGDRVGHCMR
ncbi:hypothetical protein TNCV_3414571 [Trichonephila clavipes]|uniref:Uncharacterized protein n=1 Tax=Trichonephila clavipes TaxID=2585209 RepID=A0A8X6RPH8_TRICX|nr:hypothetical protein TNCV_3414571 [Trichonephila clavipes]